MLSFYTLPSTVIGNPTYKTLKAAFMYYTVAKQTPLHQLMTDALILASQGCATLSARCHVSVTVCAHPELLTEIIGTAKTPYWAHRLARIQADAQCQHFARSGSSDVVLQLLSG